MSEHVPYFYLDQRIPIYQGKEPLNSTVLQIHQKRVLYYIRLLESENPIPILSNVKDDLYMHTNYGFYADPTCTGKSYVILSLLALSTCVERKKLLTVWSNGLGMSVYSKIKNFEIPLSILVTPLGSIGQWSELFQKETDIKFLVVDEFSKIEKINSYDYEVLLVADEVFESVCLHFQGFSVSRLIFDDLYYLDIKEFGKKDRVKFGDLRAGFTWFVSSQPQECMHKYRYSQLPFSYLMQQIFTFPYPGLLFRNTDDSLCASLGTMINPIQFQAMDTFLPNKKLTYCAECSVQGANATNDPAVDLAHYFINSLEIPIKEPEDVVKQEMTEDMKSTFLERVEQMIDPVTYEKIVYPVCLECCHQIFDLYYLVKCIYNDFRCPFCRKDINFDLMSALKKEIFEPMKKNNIWHKLSEINMNQYNIIYIPSMKTNLYRSSMSPFFKQFIKRHNFIENYGSRAFQQFYEKKGILVICRPLQFNLHLRFVDKIYVIHPKNYVVEDKKQWYSNKIWSEHGPSTHSVNYREYLSDFELGSFCIGLEKPITFELIKFC